MLSLNFGTKLDFGRVSKIFIKDSYNNDFFIDHEYFVKVSNIYRDKELMFVILTLDYNLESDRIFIESIKNVYNEVNNYINNINTCLQLINPFEEIDNIYKMKLPLVGIINDENKIINETIYNKNNEFMDINYLFEHNFEMWSSICIENITINNDNNNVHLKMFLNEAFVKIYKKYERRLNYNKFKNIILNSET